MIADENSPSPAILHRAATIFAELSHGSSSTSGAGGAGTRPAQPHRLTGVEMLEPSAEQPGNSANVDNLFQNGNGLPKRSELRQQADHLAVWETNISENRRSNPESFLRIFRPAIPGAQEEGEETIRNQ